MGLGQIHTSSRSQVLELNSYRHFGLSVIGPQQGYLDEPGLVDGSVLVEIVIVAFATCQADLETQEDGQENNKHI
jgi:hypothetical protein